MVTTGLATAAEPQLSRIATMPAGAEVTGLSSNALGDLFVNAQHPDGKNDFKDGGKPALVGYMQGFDATSYQAGSMNIPAVGDAVQVAAGQFVSFAKAGDKLGSGQLFGGVYDHAGNIMYVSNATGRGRPGGCQRRQPVAASSYQWAMESRLKTVKNARFEFH